MRANRGRDTGPELAVRRELHRRGRRFFVNRRPVATIRRTSDILFPRKKVAVLIDGCFWHGCPVHRTWPKRNSDFWREKIETNIARDIETTRLWEAEGWQVLRFWEHQLIDEIVSTIEARLDE
ncbi:very short patch repair endonuclease [Dietzia sp. 111N12-1]|nr:very short patch repair endonuclease [Dietzia sp. 111N12-1]